jgi:hypothetical protein
MLPRDAGSRTVREIVYVDRPIVAPPTATRQSQSDQPVPDARTTALLLGPGRADDSNYLVLRERTLRWGVSAAIPETQGRTSPRRSLSARDRRIETNFPGDKL